MLAGEGIRVYEIRPGLKATLNIHLGTEGTPAVGARTPSGLGR